MKTIVLLGMLSLSSLAFAETVSLGIKGMVCSMCAQGIKKKFTALGVSEVQVDLDKKQVTLVGEKVPKDDVIRKTIEEAGYALTDLKRQ